jgi:hypothetical protein
LSSVLAAINTHRTQDTVLSRGSGGKETFAWT